MDDLSKQKHFVEQIRFFILKMISQGCKQNEL